MNEILKAAVHAVIGSGPALAHGHAYLPIWTRYRTLVKAVGQQAVIGVRMCNG